MRYNKGVAIGLALGLGAFSAAPQMAHAQTNPVVFESFQAGNAAVECAQLGVEGGFTYSLKWNEAGNEEAPNGTETFTANDGHTNTITVSNSNNQVFDWSASPNSIGAVIVKAGTGANVWFYNPQSTGDVGLYAFQNKEISHITFCWNPDTVVSSQWCSPGYWRQEHHYDSWPTGYTKDTLFSAAIGYTPKRSKQGMSAGAPTDPTLWIVLQYPQWYGGDAFNAVGDLLSTAHPDVSFTGDRVEDSCPLN